MSVEMNAIISELQEQLRLLSSRAAQAAAQLATVTKERDELREKSKANDKDSTGPE